MGKQQSKLSSDILVECTAIKGQENCSEKAQEKKYSFTKYPRYENNFIIGKKEKSFADILGDKYVEKTGKAVLNCQSDHLLILSNATCDNKPKLHSERDHPWQGAIGNDECFQNMDALFCNETPVNSELKSQRNLDDEAMPGILKEGDGSLSYEYIQSQNESISLKHVIGEASKDRNIKKRPKSFQATNLQKKKSFGSLKQFDDNAYKRTKKVGGIHHKSQLEVTPETCSRWWINDAKKDVRSEVIDCDFSDDEMEESLKTIKNVSELSGDQLQYLTKVNESYLREIFQGRRACLRHTEYKSSSSLRAEMMYLVSYGDFSVDNLEIIMDTLVPIFCRKSSKFLDYVSKVLLPELLVKICMDVLHLDYKEAESLF
ncbi:putative suppressor protein SRP40-like [Apostichopus japonicus]|uniref:Putative suppressor protein SRP40-like n=1 Tax=Stichopus japonicus TaxID=307972 RepID=A0A2G8KGQ0_STIJA|nr:putative suppressor protein SRP40-like [Apostichopus japonicus]